MTTGTQSDQRKFPIGPFQAPPEVSGSALKEMINIIASAPERYREITRDLSRDDLRKTYREGSWNVQQLVHHVADMQLLHFFRMKKALTEADYKEITLVNIEGWASTPDAHSAPVADSLDMFEAIARRFVYLINSLDEQQKEIAYYHPVRKATLTQKQAVAMSAWHVQHHLAHIRLALSQ